VLESTHRHDWVACECWDGEGSGIFVDGGHDYLRRGGRTEYLEDLSEMTE